MAGPTGIRQAVRQAGLIQVDPLNVIARSHDLALHGRVVDYRSEDLDRLMYAERQAFDYGGTVYVLPMEELPYWCVPMSRRRNDPRYGVGSAVSTARRSVAQSSSSMARMMLWSPSAPLAPSEALEACCDPHCHMPKLQNS